LIVYKKANLFIEEYYQVKAHILTHSEFLEKEEISLSDVTLFKNILKFKKILY
jgi:hypothetical protein